MTSPTPSNSSQSDSELNASVKCASCGTLSTSSRVLPCLHSLCRQCSSSSKPHNCPVCATGGAVSVSSESTMLLLERSRPTGICRGCSRNDKVIVELVAQCVTCDYMICSACERSHREMGYFARHQVVPISPSCLVGRSSGGDVVTTSTALCNAGPAVVKSMNCALHPSEPLAFFCHQCNTPLCRHCCLLDDPSHRRSLLTVGNTESFPVTSTTGSSGPDINGFSSLEKIAETKATQLRVAMKNVENEVVYQQEQHQLAKEAVNDAYSIFQKALDDRRSETLRELDRIFSEKQVGAKTILQEVKAILDVFIQARSILSLVPVNGNNTDAVLLRQTLVDRMTGFLGYKPQLDLIDTSDVAFVTDLSAMPAVVHNTFGTVRCARRPTTVPSQDQCPLPYPAGHRSPAFDLQTDAVGVRMTTTEPVLSSIDIGRLSMSASNTVRRSGSPSLAADRWQNAGGSANKTAPDIFAMADMFIADFDSRSSSGKATPPVSMVHRQKISYHCQFGESGDGDGQFTEPSGVAINIITGDILVADANNHRVQVFDRQGEFLFRIGSVGKHDGALVYPNRVSVCRLSGNVIITERSPTHQVQVFTRDGTFLRKFGSHILQNPRGVTVDRLGNIIVVECKVQRVIVFCQQTGTILHKFSIMETVEFPNGVATSMSCDKIYISDNQSHCVKVFSYDGTPLGMIGGQGVTNYPIGVGVGPQGEVIVADNHNNFNLTVFSASGKLIGALESTVKHNQCYNVAFADDGTVVVACKDNHVFVYQYFLHRTSPNSTLTLATEHELAGHFSHLLPTPCLS